MVKHSRRMLPIRPSKYALPRTSRGRKDFLDAHLAHLLREFVAEDPIAIPQEISWRGVPRKGVAELLRGPLGRGMGGDAGIHDPRSVVSRHQPHVQNLKADCRDSEVIDLPHGLDMIIEERSPSLRRGLPLVSSISMPSFSGSPLRRGAPKADSPGSSCGSTRGCL